MLILIWARVIIRLNKQDRPWNNSRGLKMNPNCPLGALQAQRSSQTNKISGTAFETVFSLTLRGDDYRWRLIRGIENDKKEKISYYCLPTTDKAMNAVIPVLCRIYTKVTKSVNTVWKCCVQCVVTFGNIPDNIAYVFTHWGLSEIVHNLQVSVSNGFW